MVCKISRAVREHMCTSFAQLSHSSHALSLLTRTDPLPHKHSPFFGILSTPHIRRRPFHHVFISHASWRFFALCCRDQHFFWPILVMRRYRMARAHLPLQDSSLAASSSLVISGTSGGSPLLIMIRYIMFSDALHFFDGRWYYPSIYPSRYVSAILKLRGEGDGSTFLWTEGTFLLHEHNACLPEMSFT